MTHGQRTDGDAGVARAVTAFREGHPVLVHDADDREAETDVVYPADAVTPAAVSRLRNDAGGLVCVAIPNDVAEAVGLPYLAEALEHPSVESEALAYGDRSSFSLPVNHRGTYTGVTDDDRALTVTELADVARRVGAGEAYDAEDFAEEFRTPGHVNVLRAAPGLLAERRGHTELGVALADAAGRSPAAVVCEMLDDETGGALSKADARAYARRHDLAFLEGARVVDALA